MLPAKPFYLIRHGQTEANVAGVLTGKMETPLTPRGREQAESLHKVIKTLENKPSVVIHSSLSRARDTAAIINESLNAVLYEEADHGWPRSGNF